MPIRYRLLALTPQDLADPIPLLTKLGGFSESLLAGLSSGQWDCAVRHAHSTGAQTILLQEAVLDPDFLEEYEAFYSKQQRTVSRLCRRAHFFAAPAPQISQDASDGERTEQVLAFIDQAADEAQSQYLGFITIRPLRHAPVGATILVPAPSGPVTCVDTFPVHIAGREFQVTGTPYLQQDNAVGACAQASIWIALRTLRRRVGNAAFSPAELTVAATKHYTLNRVFPGRHGLTASQMLEAIRSAGHDPLIFDLDGTPPDNVADRAIAFATPYLESGLPVILALNNIDAGGGHALTAIGYSESDVGEPFPKNITIHNDNTGCYLSIAAQPIAPGGYALNQTVSLITPLPDGICTTAAEAESLSVSALRMGLPILKSIPSIENSMGPGNTIPLAARIFLSTRHSFRRWATESQDIDQATRTIYRTLELPKFVWILEIHNAALFQRGSLAAKSRLGEVVLDASADALHGDALVLARISGLVFGPQTQDDGLLIIENGSVENTRQLMVVKAPASHGQAQPWL